MPAPMLIAYATRSGSTAEVAEAIGAGVRQAGLAVEVTPMRKLKAVGERPAVVFGAPLYMGGLQRDVRRFLARNRGPLSTSKIWFFVLGPTQGKPEEFEAAHAQAAKFLAKFAWLKPVEVQVFGGKLDLSHMPFPFSLAVHLPAFPAKDTPPTDIRDWDAIRAWAERIARQVLPAA